MHYKLIYDRNLLQVISLQKIYYKLFDYSMQYFDYSIIGAWLSGYTLLRGYFLTIQIGIDSWEVTFLCYSPV